VGNINRRIGIQARIDKKQDTISKISKAKRARGHGSISRLLPSQSEALSSNSSTAKKKNPNPSFLIPL
jgi:hypothetical protein